MPVLLALLVAIAGMVIASTIGWWLQMTSAWSILLLILIVGTLTGLAVCFIILKLD